MFGNTVVTFRRKSLWVFVVTGSWVFVLAFDGHGLVDGFCFEFHGVRVASFGPLVMVLCGSGHFDGIKGDVAFVFYFLG
jgi:hypothetical protein